MSVKIYPTIVLEGLFSATTMESAFRSDLSSSHNAKSTANASRELFDGRNYNKSKLVLTSHPTNYNKHFYFSCMSLSNVLLFAYREDIH